MGPVLLKGENTLLDKLKKDPAFKEKGLKVIALFIILRSYCFLWTYLLRAGTAGVR